MGHFVYLDKMVFIGSQAQRLIRDVRLSRYACYLIIQNADPSKELVALGQTHFSVQTCRQELMETEAYQIRKTEEDHGYKGLYGGLSAKDIHTAKNLEKSQQILDHMGSTELAANLFRATQTDDKLRRENVHGNLNANVTHYEVGKKVRQPIRKLGGVMPENLPVEDSVLKLVRKNLREDWKGSSEVAHLYTLHPI